MADKPRGLTNIATTSNGSNASNFLNPSSNSNGSSKGRQRVASLETNESEEFKHSLSGVDEHFEFEKNIKDYQDKVSKKELALKYLGIAIEGDLAGFQIAWLCMSVGFIIMKLANITEVVSTIDWWAIFVIPICNALLTAWFDYIIREYRSTRAVESLRKTRFVALWAIKMVAAIYVCTYWVWGPGSFMERYQNESDFKSKPACNGQIICIYVAMLAAVAMAEIMITTVLINSEHGLSTTRTPKIYRWILLFIRPIVWVYNRTMVMFLCFYAIYGLMYSLFVVALLADFLCDSYRCAQSQQVGLRMLTVPFTVPGYLTKINQVFDSWDNVTNDDFLETFVVVFLCQSFYVDCLNSLWQFSRRYLKPSSWGSGGTLHSPQSPAEKAFIDQLAKELPDQSPLPPSSDGDPDDKFMVKTVALK